MRCFAVPVTVVLLLAWIVQAAGPGLSGSLRSSGIVLANAVPMPDGSTIQTGDQIATGLASLALITSPGLGRIEVRADSAARLAADAIELERGSVASSRLRVRVSGYSIRPEHPQEAWYAVAQRHGRIVVAAHRGNLLISSAAGAAPLLLAQGNVAERPAGADAANVPSVDDDQDQDQPPPARPSRKRRRRTGAVAGASTGGWIIGGLSHAASVALVVGIGAGVVAGSVGLAVSLSDQTPSTSQ